MNLRELFERAFDAYINRLAKTLAEPASVHSSKNHNGYVCLSGENANWQLCARVAHQAIPPTSIPLFKTQQGKLYFVNGRYTTAFSSSWARWMKWFPKEMRFSERSIRNLVGSEDDEETASKRLGHADRATTAKYYRLKPTVVTPLSSNNS